MEISRQKFTQNLEKVFKHFADDSALARACPRATQSLQILAKCVREEDWSGVFMSDHHTKNADLVRGQRIDFLDTVASCMASLAKLDAVTLGNPRFGEYHGLAHRSSTWTVSS